MLFFACEAARRGLFCRCKSGRISAREKAETAKAAAPGRIPPDFTSHRDCRIPRKAAVIFYLAGRLFMRRNRRRNRQTPYSARARNAFPASKDFF